MFMETPLAGIRTKITWTSTKNNTAQKIDPLRLTRSSKKTITAGSPNQSALQLQIRFQYNSVIVTKDSGR